MIKNVKVLVLALLFGAASCSFTTNNDDPGKDKVLISLISYVLEKGHYDAKEFNDEFSEQVFKDFVTALDPLKRYFLLSDIKDSTIEETFSSLKKVLPHIQKSLTLQLFAIFCPRLLCNWKS